MNGKKGAGVVDPLVRFASKFNRNGPYPNQDDFRVDERTYSTRCWPWTCSPHSTGYGIFWTGERTTTAHRFSYYQNRGMVDPGGNEVDHLCRNRLCVNPEHLDPVSFSENQARGGSNNSRGISENKCKNGHGLDKLIGPGKNIRKCSICLRWNARIARAYKRDARLNDQELNYLKKENEYVRN